MGKIYGLGFGTGRNLMPFIHAIDVANAISLWVRNGNENEIFNVVPDYGLKYKDWFKIFGKVKDIKITPFFVRGSVLKFLAIITTILKKALGKKGKVDVSYIIASATRNLSYSNNKIKEKLSWDAIVTKKYMNLSN